MNTKLAKIAAAILRRYGPVMTDEECASFYEVIDDLKEVAAAIMSLGAPFNEREVELLAKVAGNLDDYDFDRDGDLWRDDVLDKYAKYVFNYEYAYNDEAKKVDPTIDTEQIHVGPMAQDLEKVNPAVVVEDDKTGYKTVDTGRLALMNAGAIADLAREVKELKDGR